MKIILASDHAGFDLKMHVKKYLENKGYSTTDMGAFSNLRSNWAEFGAKGAEVISKDPDNSLGIIICGSGIGMSIVSNKYKNVRAALCNDIHSAEMSRKHNNANVLNMGSRVINPDEAEKIVDKWINTKFEGGRHADRLEYMFKEVENKNFK